MKVISGTHCIDDDVGEGTRIEAFDLDMLAEGSEVAIDAAQLRRCPIGVLRRRNGCDFGFWMLPILRLLHAALHIKKHTLILNYSVDRSNGFISATISFSLF